MPSITTIQEAPLLSDFVRKVRQEEEKLSYFEVPAYCLKLYDDGKLAVKSKNLNGRFAVSKKFLANLAQIADVHGSFFLNKCDKKLRSMIIDYLLPRKVPPEKRLSIVLRDQEVHSVQNGNLLFAQRTPILDTVANAKPQNVPNEDLKALVFQWNGNFDISLIAPTTLRCEPEEGDTVAFGVNVAQGRDGSIQVQGAAWRLACSNGAINRVCDSRQHRIRRPINRPDAQRDFLSRITAFAQEAWNQWPHQAEELEKLTNIPLDQDQSVALRSRLRQAPFFLSLRIVNQILERLEVEIAEHEGPPTLYDLWRAMSFLGTHRRELSHTYRRRLRYGAGTFMRQRARICGACRQLLLS